MSNPSRNGTAKRSSTARRASPQRESVSYDAFKEYEGQRYTGMKIGRGKRRFSNTSGEVSRT